MSTSTPVQLIACPFQRPAEGTNPTSGQPIAPPNAAGRVELTCEQPPLAAGGWQAQALTRCHALRATWAALTASVTVDPAVREQFCRLLMAAENACTSRVSLRQRISGVLAETAWGSVHAAEGLVVALAGPRAARVPPTGVGAAPERSNGSRQQRPTDESAADSVPTLSEASPPLRSGASEDVGAVQISSLIRQRRRGAGAHIRIRSYRNLVLLSSLLVALVVTALVVLGGIEPAALPMCNDASDLCVFGDAPQALRVATVAIVGGSGGALTAVVALRRLAGSTTPFAVPAALAWLKVPTGALTAVLGLLLVRGGLGADGLGTNTSSGLLAWAVVFGVAQQLVTRFADLRGESLLSAVAPTSTTSAGGSPPTQAGATG